MGNKTVSIIVPIYKVEKYLAKCIESVLSQTYENWELILVDDGSPDNCGAICDEYAKKDSRIVVIHQQNGGVSAARNAGLSAAKGEYIGFIDPDDFVDSTMYEKMVSAIESTNSQLAICGYNYYDEEYNAEEKRLYKVRANEEITQKDSMSRMSDMPPTIRNGVWNKLFLSELVSGIEFKVGLHSSEDVLFLAEYMKKIEKTVVVHEPLYGNLVREGSATHGGLNIESLADSFKVHEIMYETAVSTYPELKNHSLAFLLDVCTLKYNEAMGKFNNLSEAEKSAIAPRLNEMKKFIKKRAVKALPDKEIYWKTRIYYMLIK